MHLEAKKEVQLNPLTRLKVIQLVEDRGGVGERVREDGEFSIFAHTC